MGNSGKRKIQFQKTGSHTGKSSICCFTKSERFRLEATSGAHPALPKRGQLQQAGQHHIQPGSSGPGGWRLRSRPGQPGPPWAAWATLGHPSVTRGAKTALYARMGFPALRFAPSQFTSAPPVTPQAIDASQGRAPRLEAQRCSGASASYGQDPPAAEREPRGPGCGARAPGGGRQRSAGRSRGQSRA